MSEKQKCCASILDYSSRFLKIISLGKYQTKFYLKDGRGYYSSHVGGIVTLALTLFLAYNVLYITINEIENPTYTSQ